MKTDLITSIIKSPPFCNRSQSDSIQGSALKVSEYKTVPPEPEFLVPPQRNVAIAGSRCGSFTLDEESLLGYDVLQCNLSIIRDGSGFSMVHWSPSNNNLTESQQRAIDKLRKEERNGMLVLGSNSVVSEGMDHEECLRIEENVNFGGVVEISTGKDNYWDLAYRPCDDLAIVNIHRLKTLIYFNLFEHIA